MANIKSAKKRILVNETKAARNKAIRSKVKTAIKKVDAAVAAGDKAAAQAALLAATTEIDKAATKGVYHKNNASRKVSRLSKAVNSIAQFIEIFIVKEFQTLFLPAQPTGRIFFALNTALTPHFIQCIK